MHVHGDVFIDDGEISLGMIRAQGSGGQNVYKVSSAIHLRFDIAASSLPRPWKDRLLASNDQRISKDGVVVIKAQSHRSQEKNRADALDRLQRFLASAALETKPRKPTKATYGSQQRRLQRKKVHGEIKRLRGRVQE